MQHPHKVVVHIYVTIQRVSGLHVDFCTVKIPAEVQEPHHISPGPTILPPNAFNAARRIYRDVPAPLYYVYLTRRKLDVAGCVMLDTETYIPAASA
jgi:hypothetical protein